MIIYVSGPTTQSERLRLACIKIVLHGHTPICPILMCKGFFGDPRLCRSQRWFEKIVKAEIEKCDAFTYLTEPTAGCWQTKLERSLCPHDVSMVPFDMFQGWVWKKKT
jgi:hypothetical protein